jgi:hypothetical protein
LVHIDTTASLESFRRFLINSTCLSFIPDSYLRDYEVFPEKEGQSGSIYVEAADKVTLKKMRDITFVNARDILGIIYSSKSGNTKLKWRQIRGRAGRVSGEASTNSLVNLFTSRVLSKEYADQLLAESKGETHTVAAVASAIGQTSHVSGSVMQQESERPMIGETSTEESSVETGLSFENADEVEGSIEASDDV